MGRDPIFVLDADTLTPQAMIQPCPARVLGPFIGSDASYLDCGGMDGHDGQHYFRVEWTKSATPDEQSAKEGTDG